MTDRIPPQPHSESQEDTLSVRRRLLDMLRAELNGTDVSDARRDLTANTVAALYRAAGKQDLTHVVSAALDGADVPCDLTPFKKQEVLSVIRMEQQKFTTERLCGILSEAAIPFILLKGSVLRPHYPKPYMRTFCDIDVLVKPGDTQNAAACLEKHLGATRHPAGDHDISFTCPNDVHVELHFALRCTVNAEADALLARAWEFAKVKEGTQYVFDDGFFLFYHMAHMAKHFIHGGCGVRPFMDLYVMQTRMHMDMHAADELLARAGLLAFAQGAEELCRVWFADGAHTELTCTMENYLFSSTLYGSLENRVAFSRTKHSGIGHVFRRLFLPYREMVHYFPTLKKFPVLLPYFWCVRVFYVLKGGRLGLRLHEASLSHQMTPDRFEDSRFLAEKLEL